MNPNTWRLRFEGLKTVSRLEIKQRIRSKKLYVLAGLWFAFHLFIALTTFLGTGLFGSISEHLKASASFVFSVSSFTTICLLLLIIPAISAGAINGDKTQGTFAVLQATALSPAEIVFGKVIANLVLAIIFILLAYVNIAVFGLLSAVSIFALIKIFLMLVFLSLAMIMIGVGFSALTKRQLGSVVMAFAVVIGTTAVLPMIFVILTPFTFTNSTVTVYEVKQDTSTGNYYCHASDEQVEVVRTDYIIGLLKINPVVMVADMTAKFKTDSRNEIPLLSSENLLEFISAGTRELSDPLHLGRYVNCSGLTSEEAFRNVPDSAKNQGRRPVWPLGVALWGLAAIAGGVFAVNRSRTPIKKLPSGHRIA